MDIKSLSDTLQISSSIKKFDTQKKISDQIINRILTAMQYAPSSYGLQPYGFVVVTQQDSLDTLCTYSYNQPQVSSCSHLLVFTRLRKIDDEYIDSYMEGVAKKRGVPVDSLEKFKSIVKGSIMNLPEDTFASWANSQLHLTLGVAIAEASLLGVGYCPLAGIETLKYDKELGLESEPYTTSVALALGYPDDDNKELYLKKYRRSLDYLIHKI